jgi:uridine kinase
MSSVVVGVSAVSGGGKTRLVNELVHHLEDAVAVYFDDTTIHPPELRACLLDSGDYNMWRAPVLAEHLRLLKERVAIALNAKPPRYIVFDAPLGRAHVETGVHIDHMVFIDTPLDVAIARRLLRDGQDKWTDDDLRNYLDWTREVFTHHVEKVSSTADLILDGMLPPSTLTQLTATELELRSSE